MLLDADRNRHADGKCVIDRILVADLGIATGTNCVLAAVFFLDDVSEVGDSGSLL